MGTVYRKRSRGRDLGWYLAFTDADGRRRHLPSHQPGKREAQVLLAEIEGRVRRGVVGVPKLEVEQHLTVAELIERYLSDFSSPTIKNLTKRLYDYRTVLRRLLPHLGRTTAAELSRSRLSRVRDELGQRLAPNTVRLTFAVFRGVLSWARCEGLVKCALLSVALRRAVGAIEDLDADSTPKDHAHM